MNNNFFLPKAYAMIEDLSAEKVEEPESESDSDSAGSDGEWGLVCIKMPSQPLPNGGRSFGGFAWVHPAALIPPEMIQNAILPCVIETETPGIFSSSMCEAIQSIDIGICDECRESEHPYLCDHVDRLRRKSLREN